MFVYEYVLIGNLCALYHSVRVFEVQAVKGGHPTGKAVAQRSLSHTRHLVESPEGRSTVMSGSGSFTFKVLTGTWSQFGMGVQKQDWACPLRWIFLWVVS